MIANDLFSVLCDPSTGEQLVGDFPNSREGGSVGLTGVLRSASREFPVVGGIAIFRQDLMTANVIKYARAGNFRKALWEALQAEKRSTGAVVNLLLRLKWPRFIQFYGSPYGTRTGDAGAYFRYRYYVPDVPSIIGVVSCLNRMTSGNGYLLDVGCGFGHFYPYYLHAYPEEKIIFQDLSLEALVTASRLVNRKTLLVCCDADSFLPFRKNIFSDIVALDTFEYLHDKEGFIKRAIEALHDTSGTLWLTNICNPRIVGQFADVSYPPSKWSKICNADKWRIFPDRHFAEPVLRGGIVNVGVNYAPQEDHPYWRSSTLVYSNTSWDLNNKFLPLNLAPKLQQLSYNPIFCLSPGGNRLVKRKVNLKHQESHREYYGFVLPEAINIPQAVDRRDESRLRKLAEGLVMIESLCQRRRVILSESLSLLKDRFRAFFSESRLRRTMGFLIPASIKLRIKQLLRVSGLNTFIILSSLGN